jgi:uncharacterized membrane protein
VEEVVQGVGNLLTLGVVCSIMKIMDIGEVFSKSNLITLVLIVVFVFFAIFLFFKVKDQETVEEENNIQRQFQEVEGLKKEVGYSSPSEEEIQKQLNDLKNLRDERK